MNRFLKLALPLFFGICLLTYACQITNEPAVEIDMELEVPNFGLHDHNGDFHTLYYYSDAKAIVLYVQQNSCPINRNAVKDLKAVRRQFKGKGIKFFMINSSIQDDRTAIQKEAEEFDMEFPILKDKAQLVAEALQLYRTNEAIVIDPETWTVMYRGPINDRIGYESKRDDADKHYLADALDAQLKGEYPEVMMVKGKGCLIKRLHDDPAQFASISYEKEVAPILKEKCMKCHVDGGIAPWQMKNYETVFGWSPMMREVLRTKRMPPWHADPHYGLWSEDLSLTTKELQTLVHWIDAGAIKAEGESDPLVDFHEKAPTWDHGEPDMKVVLNQEDIPANGTIDYRYQEHDIEVDKDIWVTAFQVLPGNREVLHHVLVSVIYPEGFIEPIDRNSPWLDGLMAAWAPGGITEVFPENTGRIIPKGSKLHFQLHYTTNGKAQSDQSTIGLYYTDQEPANEYLMVGAFNPRLQIPPGEENYENKAKHLFEHDATIYTLFPHMHYRGKAMKFTALYPDGTREVLLNVPNYNFNWQRGYIFDKPKKVPARTVIYVDAVFDNSTQNTFNPAPEKTVYWGEMSFDEMLIGYISFEYDKDRKDGTLSMK
ncbi:MAG: redoxin domain-containing protein [Bacteroidota bacterium]